ncbi:MAG TPA: hypothetical protein PLE43_01965 [Alphaproteobacteria bacterium]|nr:hypothetical protein [Alphaproteobacteria bacterium]
MSDFFSRRPPLRDHMLIPVRQAEARYRFAGRHAFDGWDRQVGDAIGRTINDMFRPLTSAARHQEYDALRGIYGYGGGYRGYDGGAYGDRYRYSVGASQYPYAQYPQDRGYVVGGYQGGRQYDRFQEASAQFNGRFRQGDVRRPDMGQHDYIEQPSPSGARHVLADNGQSITALNTEVQINPVCNYFRDEPCAKGDVAFATNAKAVTSGNPTLEKLAAGQEQGRFSKSDMGVYQRALDFVSH